MPARFLQLHTLTSYPASLLNRDDVGFAKRIPFGGQERTRVSSQCLKRHWRTADDENALDRIQVGGNGVPMSVRSRRTFESEILEPMKAEGIDPEIATAAVEEVLKWVLPDSKSKQAKGDDDDADGESVRTQQVTVIGRPEVEHLRKLATTIAGEAEDAKGVKQAAKDHLDKEAKKNLRELGHGSTPGAGLDAALFGRMVTGDILARCDAAIHVAHAFTVHANAAETDYFSAVDDLQDVEETGSGHINTAELTSGLFYGYLVVDVPLLVSNLTGCDPKEWQSADRELAGEVVRRLVHLVTRVTPGAKLGATAPYARSLAVLAEAGDAQPRTLANAFLKPVRGRDGLLEESLKALGEHMGGLDKMYGGADASRRLAAITSSDELESCVDEKVDLPTLADWMAEQVASGT